MSRVIEVRGSHHPSHLAEELSIYLPMSQSDVVVR